MNLVCNFAHVYKTVCVVSCNFQIYKGIIVISVIALESWHFRLRTRFCLSLYVLGLCTFVFGRQIHPKGRSYRYPCVPLEDFLPMAMIPIQYKKIVVRATNF